MILFVVVNPNGSQEGLNIIKRWIILIYLDVPAHSDGGIYGAVVQPNVPSFLRMDPLEDLNHCRLEYLQVINEEF